MKPNRSILFWLILYAVFCGLWIFLRQSYPAISVEHGAMEHYQAICLLIGIGFFAAAFKVTNEKGARVFFTGMMLFYFNVIMLEVDTRQSGNALLIRLTNGKIRDIWVGLLWLGGAVYFFRNRQTTLQFFRKWIVTRSGAFVLLGGVCLFTSQFLERVFHVDFFWEELPECVAASLMLQSAWFTFRSIKPVEIK